MNFLEFMELMNKELDDELNQKADEIYEQITGELKLLRKEVADAWMHRQYERHYKAFQEAREEFVNMPIGERGELSSNQILRVLYHKHRE